jgi:cytochrome c556
MKLMIAAVTAALIGAVSLAQAAEPQEMRQESMKQVGGATGVLSKMAKGETAFDAAAAVAAFTTMNTAAKTYGDLFPVGSEAGFETEAAPAIWANMDDFKAKVAKFEADTAAAAAMTFADAAAVGAAFGSVAANCKACHETYRIMK